MRLRGERTAAHEHMNFFEISRSMRGALIGRPNATRANELHRASVANKLRAAYKTCYLFPKIKLNHRQAPFMLCACVCVLSTKRNQHLSDEHESVASKQMQNVVHFCAGEHWASAVQVCGPLMVMENAIAVDISCHAIPAMHPRNDAFAGAVCQT